MSFRLLNCQYNLTMYLFCFSDNLLTVLNGHEGPEILASIQQESNVNGGVAPPSQPSHHQANATQSGSFRLSIEIAL